MTRFVNQRKLTGTVQGPRPRMPLTSVPLSGTGVASFSSTLKLYKSGSLDTWQITSKVQISNSNGLKKAYEEN